jgi:cell division septal protein FtsQ
MKNKYWILTIGIIIVITMIISVLFIVNTFFRVRYIEVEKNFDINKEKLFEYLDIKKDKLIFNYDTKLMEEKLSRHYYLSFYKVTKIYPDKLKIEVKMKAPVAKIAGKNGIIFFIDERGIVFQKYGIPFDTPLIIYNSTEIKDGMRLNQNIKNVFEVIIYLKDKNRNVYDGISSIEICEKSNDLCDYIVNYRTNNNNFYLKNVINVDLLKEGLVCSLFLSEHSITNKSLNYTGSGFAY